MSDNYCECSTLIEMSKRQFQWLKATINRLWGGDSSMMIGLEYDEFAEAAWVHSVNGDFDVEMFATGAKALTKRFPEMKPIKFTWSYNCSELRYDEFGGGVMVAYAGIAIMWDVQDLAEKFAGEIIDVAHMERTPALYPAG